jgi:arsenate reductase
VEPTVYGIANCDQVRAARRWLKQQGVHYAFVDLRVSPPTEEKLREWLNRIPYDSLLNRRGLTWRSLPEERRRSVVDQASALELLTENPLLIKRPVLEWNQELLVGYSESLYAGLGLDHAHDDPTHP